jgi:Pyridoxal-phosphate dependent enzyme
MSMCVTGTPLEHYPDLGLWVKREDMCCPGGPNFSKARGVYAHIAARPEPIIGVLDTSHSQGGWAVARACSMLGRVCHNFYPWTKKQQLTWEQEPEDTPMPVPPVQRQSRKLGALLHPLPAGRSAVLYHRARAYMQGLEGGYMMPNALKLPESVAETAGEFNRTQLPNSMGCVLVSASSATIAAGVLRGMSGLSLPLVVHLGYSRSHDEVRRYMTTMAGWAGGGVHIVDEGYSYADQARPGPTPDFPCDRFYDLKALRWWVREGCRLWDQALFWNIG